MCWLAVVAGCCRLNCRRRGEAGSHSKKVAYCQRAPLGVPACRRAQLAGGDGKKPFSALVLAPDAGAPASAGLPRLRPVAGAVCWLAVVASCLSYCSPPLLLASSAASLTCCLAAGLPCSPACPSRRNIAFGCVGGATTVHAKGGAGVPQFRGEWEGDGRARAAPALCRCCRGRLLQIELPTSWRGRREEHSAVSQP
jgi:hypothetical protein